MIWSLNSNGIIIVHDAVAIEHFSVYHRVYTIYAIEPRAAKKKKRQPYFAKPTQNTHTLTKIKYPPDSASSEQNANRHL